MRDYYLALRAGFKPGILTSDGGDHGQSRGFYYRRGRPHCLCVLPRQAIADSAGRRRMWWSCGGGNRQNLMGTAPRTQQA